MGQNTRVLIGSIRDHRESVMELGLHMNEARTVHNGRSGAKEAGRERQAGGETGSPTLFGRSYGGSRGGERMSRCVTRLAMLLLLASTRPSLLADDIVVQEIGGVPVITCKLHCNEKSIEAHVLFDMGLSVPMVIHEKSVGGFDLTPKAADGRSVDIEFAGGGQWSGIPMRVADVALLANLTAKYATELKEVPVIAILGLPAIKSSVVELDLRRGLLRTLGMGSSEARAQEVDYAAKPYGIVLDAIGPSETPVKALMIMREEDSVLDISLLQAARRSGDTPNVLSVGGVVFSDQTAFRFRSLAGVAPEPISAVIGVGAMRNCMVTIWPQRGKIAFLAHEAAPFPQAEQDYFFALADKKPEGVAEFISKQPRRRLMDEACIKLLELRLEDPASTTEMVKEALQTIGSNYDATRCCIALSKIADTLEKGERADSEQLAMFALDEAMKQAGAAFDQTAVHGVHLRLGRKALGEGDLKQSRRHLLSAAFGMPKNGECNFWLGELYREMGKPRRAWSRYFQAILDPKVAEIIRLDSLARLDELNRDPEFRKSFNMVVAEQYMAGRLEEAEFHAKSRYQLVRNRFPGHVKLVEFFANATDPDTGGMQLAFQSLDEYFEGRVALIEYHVKDPMQSEVAEQRLAFYSAERAPLAVFDGTPLLRGSASEAEKLSDNAAENEPAFRDACLREEPVPTPEWTLAAKMVQEGSKVSGTLTVTGAGERDTLRLHVMLCERSVMALEGNGVFFHHFVARHALTPPEGLELKRALAAPVAFAVDAEAMREALTRMLASATRGQGLSRPTYVDANKLMLVALVQDRDSREVLTAESFSLPQEDEVP